MTDSNAVLDERMMRRALDLAKRGIGWASPNPMVGAIVCRDGKIVGEGYHAQYGEAHAEPRALDQAGEAAQGATLYVTLEPCAHHGKTPPCLDRVLASGVSRIVIAMRDPNPRTDGRSIETLRERGVEVEVGLLEDEARSLNLPFLSNILRGRPWVTAKYAMTLDGRVATATGDSKWISNPSSRSLVQDLRRRNRAVLVGARTALLDNPTLTCRGDFDPPARQPTRLILGGTEPLPPDSNLVRTSTDSPVLCFDGSLEELMKDLHERDIDSLLVEGGSEVLSGFFAAGLTDEVYAFIAPKILDDAGALSPFASPSGREKMSEARSLASVEIREIDGDALVHGYLTQL